jgi:gas vesicle protein
MSKVNRNDEGLEQVKMEERQNGSNTFLFGAIVGGIVGAATALYFSGKSSKGILSTFNEVRDYTVNKGNELMSMDKSNALSKISKQIGNKVSDFSEKEEHNEIKYVSIQPKLSSQAELEKKLQEARAALEEEELKIQG